MDITPTSHTETPTHILAWLYIRMQTVTWQVCFTKEEGKSLREKKNSMNLHILRLLNRAL